MTETDRAGGQAYYPAGVLSYQVKDSGARERYDSGMVRDTSEGKADYTLLPLEFLERWAEHMTKGAVKYGRDNWRKANSSQELQRFRSSALRHMFQWLSGDRDEDHASAVAFNVAAAESVVAKLSVATPLSPFCKHNDSSCRCVVNDPG